MEGHQAKSSGCQLGETDCMNMKQSYRELVEGEAIKKYESKLYLSALAHRDNSFFEMQIGQDKITKVLAECHAMQRNLSC